MTLKNSQYCLLHPVDSTEEFLKENFKASSSKIKKYFSKSFLNRSFKERSILDLPLNFINDGEINPVYIGSPLKILHEDENLFVFNKEANQFVHPLSYDESDNCLSFIRQTRPELLTVNRTHYDRGLLYRLDYETSGVMIYVKKDELYQDLRVNFDQRAIEKKYLCLVSGQCKLQGTFKHAFSSSLEKGKKVVVSSDLTKDQVGELSVKPLEYDSVKDTTLIEVILKSGLRHQIRAQLAHLGYPLLGDEFYGGKPAQRLYLHALSYRIEVLGKESFFESKPNDFE
jgi:23S rRNA pseudouridine1911/1915/1917 synthase